MEMRPYREAVKWFLQEVDQMEIQTRYKAALLGMTAALERIHDLSACERVTCADCQNHSNRTQMCDAWMRNTPANGYCYRAKERSCNEK